MTGFFNPFAGSAGGGTDYNNLTNKPTINGVTVQGSLTTGDLLITAADVGALPSGTKYGADFALTIDSQTFIVTAQLKDQDGNNLGQAKTIDLPLETMVIGGRYDDTTQKVILTLKNGQTVEFSVADLVNGLQSEITLNNKLDADLVSDVSSENKFVTAAEKSAWNRKQEAISDLSTIRSGAAAGATALQQSDVSSTYSASGTAPVNGTAVAAALGTLDVSSVGGSGKYISAISESNGKISATETTMDITPTANSTNPVTSGGVAASQATQDAEIAWNVNQGVKNLIELSPNTYTSGNVVVKLNDDGTVSVSLSSGSTANTIFSRAIKTITNLRDMDLILNGCPSGGNYSSGYALYISDDGTTKEKDEGNGVLVPKNTTVTTSYLALIVRSGTAISGTLTFKPMIRPASITDPTFQPYALPNPTLTPAAIKAVDEGAKNLSAVNSVTNQQNYIDIDVNLKAGKYIIFAGSISTTSSNTSIRIGVYKSPNNLLYTYIDVGSNKYSEFEISGTADVVRIFATNSVSVSSGESLTFSDLMLCTAADWAVSQKFVPYRPSYDNLIDEVSQLKNYIGYEKSQILGLQVDYQNKTFTRLGKAADLTPSSDFNQFNIYNKRRRCNVSDDGTINAFYGESSYIEDGTNGQVMVYQPKFYYKVEPLKLEPIVDGEGYHIRKANYYISETPRNGFKLHPAFKDENGNELEYYLIGAYEASLYDASKSTYILDDAQVADFSADKICSIANAKPISGLTQNLTRSNCEKLAINRGTRWHNMTIQIASAEQLLFMIEYGKMNAQEAIGMGVVNKASGNGNESINTGSTSSLGNASGAASGTDGLVSIAYRGVENLWGNIWSWIDGVNIWGDGTKKGGIPYVTNKLPFVENTKTDYKSVGFTTSDTNGFISAMGYGNPDYDWVFFASETIGNSALPVGDYQYYTANLNGYRVAVLGGSWADGLRAGLFYWYLYYSSSTRSRAVGGRGVIIPDINATNYWTNIHKAS